MGRHVKPALVIMAAGIGSRYGGGIKQLEPVGANGEIIMDYSIHDALAAGFRKIILSSDTTSNRIFAKLSETELKRNCSSGCIFPLCFSGVG